MLVLSYILQGFLVFIFCFTIFVAFIHRSKREPGEMHEAYSNEIIDNPTTDNKSVFEQATKIAHQLYYGKNEKYATKARDMYISVYNEVKDIDDVIIYNSGGFGWADFKVVPAWPTIMKGIQEIIESHGETTKVLNYFRTYGNFWSAKTESDVMTGDNPYKSDELSGIINILLDNTDCKIILTGESQGAGQCEFISQRFKDEERVFSIQTGSPFWNLSKPHERSIVINNNGDHLDTFAHGDWSTIIKINAKKILHRHMTVSEGDIFTVFSAPGHYYSWDHPVVRTKVTEFVESKILKLK